MARIFKRKYFVKKLNVILLLFQCFVSPPPLNYRGKIWTALYRSFNNVGFMFYRFDGKKIHYLI